MHAHHISARLAPSSPASAVERPRRERGVRRSAPDDDAVIRERDAGLDEWLDDRARAEAAADPDRISCRDDLAGFIAAYQKFHGPAEDETDLTHRVRRGSKGSTDPAPGWPRYARLLS